MHPASPCAAVLAILCSPALAGGVPATRVLNGHTLEIAATADGAFEARVDGKVVLRSGDQKGSMAIEGVHSGNGRTYALISKSFEGCDARFYAIDLTRSRPAVSKAMGDCSPHPVVEIVGGAIKVTARMADDSAAIDIFAGGHTTSFIEPAPQRIAGPPRVPADCTADAVRADVLTLLKQAVAGGREWRVPGAAELRALRIEDADAVTSEPILFTGIARSPTGTPLETGGLRYDGAFKRGAADPGNLTLCRATLRLRVAIRPPEDGAAPDDAVLAPIRYILQPLDAGDYNFTVFGLHAAAAAAYGMPSPD